MNELTGALRAVHYASAILLLGEVVFMLGVSRPALRRAPAVDDGDAVDRRFFAVAYWGLVASMASGAAWFAVQAAIMSGLPAAEAMTRETLGLVLGNTEFGLVFVSRTGLAVALAAVLIAMRRSSEGARRSGLEIVAVTFAAGYLGSLAWTGHAVPGDEPEYLVQIVADVAHLLAAGTWLGALPALVFVLGRARARDAAADAARRFSILGVASVVVLTASGLVNAWYLVGGIPGLVGTDYGRLLAAKLALFAAMLGLATVNRGIATRPFSGGDHEALRRLRRNATLEIALGIGVIAIVGVLGVTVPAKHQPVIWPFDRTLSFDSIQQSAGMQFVVAAAGMLACIAALALVAGALSRPPHIRSATVAGIVIPGAILVYLLAVPSYPTTYLVSPVRYTADAVATGSTLYAVNCSVCHGRHGRGIDSVELSSPNTQLDLSDRVPHRREGNLFWSIAHGVSGTPMPGFAPQMSDVEIWSLIRFLDAQTAARNALAMSDRIRPLRPVPAPDFTYELSGRPQESLRQQRGNLVTLLVFYTTPSSVPRLLELATLEGAYTTAGARLIALPMPASPAANALERGGDGGSLLALASPAVATTYMMFAPEVRDDVDPPAHLEYLIDRFGFLRVRRVGVPAAVAGGADETRRQIDALVQEPPRASVQWGHRH